MLQSIALFAEAGAKEVSRQLVLAATGSEIPPGLAVDTNEQRASVRVTINTPSSEVPVERTFYPLPGDAEIDAAHADFRLGDTIWHKWIAEHANILEGGRRPDRHGRMIGSEQTPDGAVHLARDRALSRMDRWRFQGAPL